jgi:hypothetical protein
MNHSTYSFEYISGEEITDMLKAIDFSKVNNMHNVIEKQCKMCMTQDWVDNLELESDLNNKFKNETSIKNIHLKIENHKLPEVEVIHQMSLDELIAYEAMLVNILHKVKPNVIVAANILLHLKIITNHLIYKFKIFE